ncbi:hypothetical protein [Nocardia sp. X0981]
MPISNVMSTLRRKKPAVTPSTVPTVSASSVAPIATESEIWAPWTTRLSRSRPSGSVPNMWAACRNGGIEYWSVIFAGSGSGSTGAATAASVIAASQDAPARAPNPRRRL